MKDEVFPEIPQEQIPQAHSMYEQLRKTSQKWFSRSHKRIFDGKSNYQPSDASKFSRSQQMINNGEETKEQSKEEKAKLMQLMRQQIEICCQQFATKMKSHLQDQARKIKLLGDLLVKNQLELSKKSQLIEQIGEIVFQNKQTGQKIAEKDLSLIEKRGNQLEDKLKELQKILKENNQSERITTLENRFNSAVGKLYEGYLLRLDDIRYDLEERIDRAQKLIHLNCSTSKGVRSSTISVKDSDKLQKKLDSLIEQLEDLKEEMQSFKEKRYSYDNYKLLETEQKIQKIQKTLSSIELNKREEREEQLFSRVGFKGSQTTQLTHTEVEGSINLSSKSKFINRYKSMINSRKLKEYKDSSESQSQSQNQSEVQATMVEGEEQNNVQRFVRVLRQTRLACPILIEIDQTGYVKSADTGMYLVDGTGNGFQFTLSELDYLHSKGIIQTM